MTKEEFQKLVEKCREVLLTNPNYLGVCPIIQDFIGTPAFIEFREKFCPPSADPSDVWLNDCGGDIFNLPNIHDGMGENERRLLFLDAFEGYMLSEGFYTKWDKTIKMLA